MGRTSATGRPPLAIADDALNNVRAAKESLQQLESLLHTLMLASPNNNASQHQRRTLQLGTHVAFEAWAYADDQLRVLDAELDALGSTVAGDV